MHPPQELCRLSVPQFLCLEQLLESLLLRGSCPLDQCFLEDIVGVVCGWAEHQISPTSGDKEATTKSNLAFWLLSLLVAKVASTWTNHTAGSAGQKGGILILTAVAATTGGSAGGSAGGLAGGSMMVVDCVGGHQCRVAKPGAS